MKKHIVLIFLLLFTVAAEAQESIIKQADEAYMKEDYEQALELYVDAARLQGTSAALYYNIANTYYRLGYPGQAVLYYRKSLKLDPSFGDARTNLRFVESQLIDKQETARPWRQRVTENVIFLMTPNAWAVTGIIFFIIFLTTLGFYILGGTVGIRKAAFFGGIFFAALTVLCTVAAFYSSGLARSDKEAVVTVPVVQLSTVPRVPADKSQQAFTLHEGALVEIMDTLKVPTDSVNPVWMEVMVNKEHRAWLPASAVEKI